MHPQHCRTSVKLLAIRIACKNFKDVFKQEAALVIRRHPNHSGSKAKQRREAEALQMLSETKEVTTREQALDDLRCAFFEVVLEPAAKCRQLAEEQPRRG
jgi:hypothetical protein